LEQWLYQAGIPRTAQIPVSESLDAIDEISHDWALGEITTAALPAGEWSPLGVVRFINALPAELNERQLVELDDALGLSASGNAEITRSWFIQVAKRRHQPAYPAMEDYLARYGRIRLIAPVYDALVKNGQDQQLAQQLYTKNQAHYHPATREVIQTLLNP
jgi:hypothetical protein